MVSEFGFESVAVAALVATSVWLAADAVEDLAVGEVPDRCSVSRSGWSKSVG